MRIVILSHVFAPSIGGIETVTRLLARGLVGEGHEVVVVTRTPGADEATEPYEIVRQPRGHRLWSLCRDSSAVIQSNFSFRTFWPPLVLRRPVIVVHHMWFNDDLLGWLKKRTCRLARNVGVSRAIAEAVGGGVDVIANPYDDELFRVLPDERRSQDLIFVGRLIPNKGCDLLLEAMARLQARGRTLSCTIVGQGPELTSLEALARRLGLSAQVRFTGAKTGMELVRLLNQHKIMVVPSRWAEPFGVVALEGIATGCVVVGSAQGGLPEAIGPCGRVFPNEDIGALAAILEEWALERTNLHDFRREAPAHLGRHTPRAVARDYLARLAAMTGPAPARPTSATKSASKRPRCC